MRDGNTANFTLVAQNLQIAAVFSSKNLRSARTLLIIIESLLNSDVPMPRAAASGDYRVVPFSCARIS
jgi:hypothetical protein